MPISHDYERVPGPQGKAGRTTARLLAAVLAAAAVALPVGAGAQIVTLPSGNAPGYAIGYGAAGDSYVSVDPAHPLPVGDRQEAFALVSANAPAAPQTVFGGDYILAQSCAAYGTLALQVRGPDGATFQTIISKTASDSIGGTGLALGSLAVVQAVASGTTGCNVTLSRVP